MSKNTLLKLSAFLYLVSLALPAYFTHISQTDPGVPGWGVLLTGWMALLNFEPRWLANPVYFYAMVCLVGGFRVRAPGAVLGLMTTVALSVVFFPRWTTMSGSLEAFRFSYGAFTWAASLLLASWAVWVARGPKA